LTNYIYTLIITNDSTITQTINHKLSFIDQQQDMITTNFNDISDNRPQKSTTNGSVVIDSNIPRLVKLSLKKIHGIHRSIIDLDSELAIPPQKIPSKYAESLTSELPSILSRNYPHVFRDKRLWCVGNVRAYKIAKKISRPDMQIICVELFGLTAEEIRSNYLYEYLLDPAIFGLHASDISALAVSARKAIAKGLLRSSDCSIETYLSKLYCVDKRKLQKHSDLNLIDPMSVKPESDIRDAHSINDLDHLPMQ